MRVADCEGWWEQWSYGRQPMNELRLQFDGGTLHGAGVDVVGEFTLDGILADGQVRLSKHYLGQHSVGYVGEYDGEGSMHGEWDIEGLTGRWAIRILPHRQAAGENTPQQISPR